MTEPQPAHSAIGTVDLGPLATVDGRGTLRPAELPLVLEWWIGADDRWHDATHEVAVRQHSVGDAPVVATAMRVPGGDARATVYATSDAGGVTVLDVENDSPAPFALAISVRPAGRRLPSVEADGNVVRAAGRPLLVFARPPGDLRLPAAGDDGPSGLPEPLRDRARAVAVVPVAHRSRTRVAILPAHPRGLDVARLADADAVARAWAAQLRRGMQVELPDARWPSAIARARAQVLLAGSGPARVAAATVAALEDWGFDTEVERMWARLGVRAKRRAARRARVGGRDAFAAADALATPNEAGPLTDPAALLNAARTLFVDDGPDGVDLLTFCPDAWKGGSLDVRDAPTRHGSVSYAIRWHGPRPALLWECRDRVPLTCSGLSAEWTTVEPSGEVLL